MQKSNEKTDEEKGDEVLRRMLNTPPKPHLHKQLKTTESKDEKSA